MKNDRIHVFSFTCCNVFSVERERGSKGHKQTFQANLLVQIPKYTHTGRDTPFNLIRNLLAWDLRYAGDSSFFKNMSLKSRSFTELNRLFFDRQKFQLVCRLLIYRQGNSYAEEVYLRETIPNFLSMCWWRLLSMQVFFCCVVFECVAFRINDISVFVTTLLTNYTVFYKDSCFIVYLENLFWCTSSQIFMTTRSWEVDWCTNLNVYVNKNKGVLFSLLFCFLYFHSS